MPERKKIYKKLNEIFFNNVIVIIIIIIDLVKTLTLAWNPNNPKAQSLFQTG